MDRPQLARWGQGYAGDRRACAGTLAHTNRALLARERSRGANAAEQCLVAKQVVKDHCETFPNNADNPLFTA